MTARSASWRARTPPARLPVRDRCSSTNGSDCRKRLGRGPPGRRFGPGRRTVPAYGIGVARATGNALRRGTYRVHSHAPDVAQRAGRRDANGELAAIDGKAPGVELAGTSNVTLPDYTREIVASGFPGLRSLSGRVLRAQLDGYLARVVDRDVPELGVPVRRPHVLRRWMTAYAAAISTTASLETVRDAATGDERDKPARSTSIQYRETLERLWIIDPVPAWLPTLNARTPLSQAPKSWPIRHLRLGSSAPRSHRCWVGRCRPVCSSGRVRDPNKTRDGSMIGRLFESLVTLDVRVYAQGAECRVRHLRTYNGRHEIDLIVERDDGRVLAIEVKLGASVTDDESSTALAHARDATTCWRRDRDHDGGGSLSPEGRDWRRAGGAAGAVTPIAWCSPPA